MEITELIENSLPSMSKGHKAIANYILESYDKAAYMTAARLGEVVGVSESTVVRFTTELGYEGYPEFQKALKEELKSKLTSVQRLDFAEQFSDESDAVSGIMSQDIQNLKDTLASIDEAEFKKAVNSILNALKNGAFYSSCGPEIYDFYVKDGHCVIECSPVKKLRVHSDCHPTKVWHDPEGKLLTYAAFDIESHNQDYGYVRMSIMDENGNYAWTNPIFLD